MPQRFICWPMYSAARASSSVPLPRPIMASPARTSMWPRTDASLIVPAALACWRLASCVNSERERQAVTAAVRQNRTGEIGLMPVSLRRTSSCRQHLLNHWDDLRAEQLDAGHELVVRECDAAVFHIEARDAERAGRRRDLRGDRFRRTDIQRAVRSRFTFEVIAAHRRPAALGADARHHLLIVRPHFLLRLRIGGCDVTR